jgi:preprotein translocase subunit SecF
MTIAYLKAVRLLVESIERKDKTCPSLHEYYRKIQRLSDLIDEEKLFIPIEKGLSKRLEEREEKGREGESNLNRAELRARNRVTSSQREQLLGPNNKHTEKNTSPEEENFIENSEEMLKMVEILKNNSLSIQDLLKQDKIMLEKTEDAMSSNSLRLEKESKRVKIIARKYSTTFWTQLFLVLLVVFVFIFMYFFIKWVPKKQNE